LPSLPSAPPLTTSPLLYPRPLSCLPAPAAARCQVSDLDDEMVFYLQARGLGRVEARSLLLAGWARDALESVPSESAKVRAADKAAKLAPEAERKLRRESLSSI
jgi:hypothetical protein